MQRAVAAVPLVLVPALGATQGGFQPDTWVWSGALAAWGAAIALVVATSPGALRRAWPWLAASSALLLWTLASMLWSAHAAQSLLEARRTLVYVAVVLALLLLARRDAPRLLVPATHIAISGLLLYALARYLLSPRRLDPFELHDLNQPLGYANAAGILAVLAILLALGLVAETTAAPLRIAAAASVPLLAGTLVLTESNASDLALGVGLAATALLTPHLVRLLAALALVGPAAAIAAAVAVVSRLTADAPRMSGSVLLVVLLACAGLAALAATRVRLPAPGRDSARARRIVLAAVLVVAVAGGAVVAHAGSTEPRGSYFHVAWHDEVVAHPLLGTGAGTFGLYWARSGNVLELGGALDAHSLYLETLAELGPLGLLLLLAMLLAPLRGVLRHRAVAYVPAAAGAYAAFLVHAGLDWDWELPAVVVAALCCAAAVAAADLHPGRPLGGRARAALLGLSFAVGACAIAGARSHTVPAAAETEKAPQSRAFSQTRT